MNEGDFINNTYHVLQPLGGGGLGDVYLGYHENLRKYVVIKRIKEYCRNLVNVRSEVDILKSLHHMYLPQVYDFVQSGTEIFTVMDYISGQDLQQYMNRGAVFTEEQLVRWMRQLLDVLGYLHSRTPQILHCDIKPGNIMITEEGNVCLIDFNISLDGENNKDLVGISSYFASPEQAEKAEYKLRYGSGDGVELDARSDLYSLAAVFYYLMTGVYPNAKRENFLEISEIVHPYSDALENIVARAMRPEAKDRFKDAADMQNALDHMYRWSNAYRRLSRITWAVDIGFGILVIVLLSMMITGWQGMQREAFSAACGSYMRQVESLTYTADTEEAGRLLEEGEELLGEESYRKQFSRNREKKAEVLYAAARSACILSEYGTAEDYLTEAVELDGDEAEYYRDLAVACAENGHLRAAKEATEEALDLGLSGEDVSLVQGEIALRSGEYEDAYANAGTAAESRDEEIRTRAAILAMAASEQLGNTDDCIALLEAVAEDSGSTEKIFWLRCAGGLAYKIRDYVTAERCLVRVKESGFANLTDLCTLASVYEDCEQLDACQKLLEEMAEAYPEEYVVYLRLSRIAYRRELRTSARSFSAARAYYETAEALCRAAGENPSSDAEMVQMKNILTQLGLL